MATAIRETELKYDAAPGAPLPDLRGLPQVASQSESDEVRLDATYYDTANFDLARAGVTLRRRSGGGDAGWHLKIPSGDDDTRVELQLPPGPEVPGEFVGLLTARLRGRGVRPVATIRTRRRSSTLADASGEALAEIALDAVTAEALGSPAALSRWNEVEIELAEGVDGGARLLAAADRELRRSGLTRSAHRMKLEAALGQAMPVPAPEPATGRKAGAGDVLLAYLRGQVEELLYRDVLVRRAEPDAVHRMRVAARRIRAVLQEFARLFRGAQGEHLIGELRWLGQELGQARDEEVLRDVLLGQLEQVPAESALGPVRARITGHFAPRMAEAERHAVEVLDSRRYLELLDDLEAFIARPPLVSGASRRATDVLPRLVRRSQRRVARRMRAARQASDTDYATALHDARKAAKRARYAAEAASLAVGKKAGKSAKALKQVQSTLGDHHDAVITAGELRSLGIHAHAQGENAFTYGLLHARQYERARELAESAQRMWRRADRRKRTAWMA
jgi:CHAD domain-containing protein